MEDKHIFFVTFGQKSPLRNAYVECRASSKQEASLAAYDAFGTDGWSSLYEEAEFVDSINLFTEGRVGEILEGR